MYVSALRERVRQQANYKCFLHPAAEGPYLTSANQFASLPNLHTRTSSSQTQLLNHFASLPQCLIFRIISIRIPASYQDQRTSSTVLVPTAPTPAFTNRTSPPELPTITILRFPGRNQSAVRTVLGAMLTMIMTAVALLLMQSRRRLG